MKCAGCGTEFPKPISCRNHQRRCLKYQTETARRLHLANKNRKRLAEQTEEEIHLADTDAGLTVSEEPQSKVNDLPEHRPSGRRNRQAGLPSRYKDAAPPPKPRRRRLPGPPNDVVPVPPPPIAFVQPQQRDPSIVYRFYPEGRPLYSPDGCYGLGDSINSSQIESGTIASKPWFASYAPSLESLEASITPSFAPFPNISIFRLMSWYYGASNFKSHGELDRLVDEVILAEDFDANHFAGFRAAKETQRMDKYCSNSDKNSTAAPDTAWIESSVFISLPCDGVKHTSEADAPRFEVKGLFHRRLIDLIRAGLSEVSAEKLHLFPFYSYWQPSPDLPEERIYQEPYTCDHFLSLYDKLFKEHRTGPNANLTPVIIGLMIWSDSTHLTSFGTASAWPIYIYFANLSKYDRAKPSSFAAHHLAYIPKLGDDIQEAYKSFFGKTATAEMLTHLRRELMQAVWLVLLDDEFMHAYIHGIRLDFVDDDPYLFFPRFLTDSADYPEKILLACLKYLAQCPCPRCLILKSKIPLLGSKSDMKTRKKHARIDNNGTQYLIDHIRELLFVEGINISSVTINRPLKERSLVPTRSAFSIRFFEHGLNYYQMFVPDLLHEFELGVWRSTFTHLIRILHAHGDDTISVLNSRYRNIPPFGQSTIRKFHNNASAMKKLAARDFEDLLQCSIPVFEGLLPSAHDKIVRTLLFELATWHALAKLRLHTESSVRDLESSTTRLGESLRAFEKDVCPAYDTKELPSEQAARSRRRARKKATGTKTKPTPETASSARRQRKFNMETYKNHSLGDYAEAIRLHGTTDSYTTQTGELEHRRPKRFYPRVRKGQHIRGIGKEVSRERLLHLRKQRNFRSSKPQPTRFRKRKFTKEKLPPTSPTAHHHMSSEIRNKLDLPEFLEQHDGDPAIRDFLPNLRNHLLARLLGVDSPGTDVEFTDSERATLQIENNRIYKHQVLRVNYTTYDNRRSQDVINPRTRPDVIMLSGEDENGDQSHPYWYARVLMICHARILHTGPLSKSPQWQSMEFLFVRWFSHDVKRPGGWNHRRLYTVRFSNAQSEPFGFVDPARLLRATHLIPGFARQETKAYLGPSKLARRKDEGDEDWDLFYVNKFVDRDMFMRYRGGGLDVASTKTWGNRESDRIDGEEEECAEQEVELEDEAMAPDGEVDSGVEEEEDLGDLSSGPDNDDESDEEGQEYEGQELEGQEEEDAGSESGSESEDEVEQLGFSEL